MAIYINDKITRRGIAKGLVSIQEDLNNSILKVEKQTMEALLTTETKKQYNHLLQAKYIMKVETWTDIRNRQRFRKMVSCNRKSYIRQ